MKVKIFQFKKPGSFTRHPEFAKKDPLSIIEHEGYYTLFKINNGNTSKG